METWRRRPRLFGGHHDAGEGAGRAGQGDLTDGLGEQTTDGVDVLVLDLAVEELAQFGDRVTRGHAPHARLDFFGFDGVAVVLVG